MTYSKLRGLIREKFGTQLEFAKALGINESTLSSKLAKKTDWTKQEIALSMKLLEVDPEEIVSIFFVD